MTDLLLSLLGEKIDPSSIKKVSPRSGGEYHSPCPKCGGTDRFITFPEQEGGELCQKHGVTGTWACPRHCKTGGDAITFLMEFDGLTFSAACQQLGIGLDPADSNKPRQYRALRRPELKKSPSFTPASYAAPSAAWSAQATKLALEAHDFLLNEPHILRYLARRGLPLAAVQAYRLGYIEGEDKKTGTCIFRQRSAFGLPLKTRGDGTASRALRIPRGITIPAWAEDGSCLRIRIRKRDRDLDPNNKKDSKYILIPQPENPYSAPLVLPPLSVSPELSTWVIVEAELDAMALHHACGGRAGAVSVLTVAGKPDKKAHELLSKAVRILVALDFDSDKDGKNTSAEAWQWWKNTYASARLWPVPVGKDPGEAFAAGADLHTWVSLGLPVQPISARTPQSGVGAGPVGASVDGASSSEGQETQTAPLLLSSSLPLPDYFPLENIPANVLFFARLLQGKPVRFIWYADKKGQRTGGYEWWWDNAWGRAHWSELGEIQHAAGEPTVWQWLVDHQENVITANNFLFLLG